MSFEVLKSELIYNGPAFEVRRDQLRLPDGNLSWLDIVDHRQSVTMIPVDREGAIWFINQYRHPAGKELFELPAGVMELGELPEVSAQREMREEIGMGAGKLLRIGGFYLAPGYSTEFMHIFLASELYPDPLPGDQDEFLSIERVPARQALEMAESGQIQDAKSLAALFWARSHLARLGFV